NNRRTGSRLLGNITSIKNKGLIKIDEFNLYIQKFDNYIKNEVLADELFNNSGLEGYKEEVSISDYKCEITIKKVV
ncbi:MAG: hypothetical protein KDC88_08540, partial [Ignavibacteriae bacterium]|nr:hypothetical protein [Ignavibacteriota bacterium]